MDSLCTGVAANWCPVHGDCTCPSNYSTIGAAIRASARGCCPLHCPASTHAPGDTQEIARGATLSIGDELVRVTRIHDEPNTGLCQVLDLRTGLLFTLPVKWLRAAVGATRTA